MHIKCWLCCCGDNWNSSHWKLLPSSSYFPYTYDLIVHTVLLFADYRHLIDTHQNVFFNFHNPFKKTKKMVRENGMETTTFPQNVIIVASLAAIGFSIWSRFNESATHFQKVWEMPSLILILSVFLLVFSVMILVGRLHYI